MAAKKCFICSSPFHGRADAKTCSPRCRKRLQQLRFSLAHNEASKDGWRKSAAIVLLGMFGLLTILFSSLAPSQQAQALTAASNLNFQARLLNASGAVVPDGVYNIDFKIYNADSTTGSVGTCSGACLWEETRKVFSSQGVTVTNGYYSVNLGSVTSFPTTINWDQQLYLTMNVTTNGTQATNPITADWNGEMQNAGHSVALTAVPLAFRANQLAVAGTNEQVLQFANSTFTQTTTISLPDPGATTANVCYQGAAACGFALGTTGSYIQNATGGPQSANFNIISAAPGSIGAIVHANATQSVDIFDVQSSASVVYLGVNSTGTTISLGATNPTISASAAGSNLTLSANAAGILTLGNTAGGTVNLGTANTTTIGIGNTSSTVAIEGSNSGINIGNGTTAHTINIGAGGTNTQAVNIGSVNGSSAVQILGGTGATAVSVQAGTNGTISIGSSNANTVNIGKTSGNAVSINSGNANISLTTNGASGGTVVKTSTNNSTAFQVQNAVGASLLVVDTTSTDSNGATLNYLTYAGFESGLFNNAVGGWNKAGAATLSQNTNKQHTYNGTHSALVTTTAASGDGLTTSSFTSAPPANTYIVSFYAKLTSGASMTGANFTIATAGGAASCSPSASTTLATATVGFQRLYCSLSPAATVTGLTITQNVAVAHTLYIDSVQLQPNDYNGGTNNITQPTAYQFGEVQIRGAVTSPLVIANNGDSTGALQVQNAAGNSVLAVDTLNGQVLLGNSSSLNGTLTFANNAGANTVSLVAQASNPASSVTIQLPVTGASGAGQCVLSDTGSTTTNSLLKFGTCASGTTSSTKVVAMGSVSCTTTGSAIPVASLDTNADYIVTSGANGTACTSAQTTINTAITALGTTGGTVYLKEGTYIIDGTINMASNVTLAGSGPGTVIKFKDSVAGSTYAVTAATKNRLVIRDIKFDGNKANQTNAGEVFEFTALGSGTGTSAVPGVKVNNVYVENFKNGASTAHIYGSTVNSSITNSWFINDDSLYLGGVNYFNFSNNTVMGSAGWGVYLSGGTNNTISNNTIQGSSSAGIEVDSSATNNVITNNVLAGNSKGVEIIGASTTGNTISSNTISSNTTQGIMLNSAPKNTVTGNIVTGNADAIYSTGADYSTITGNTISGNSGNGVYLQSNNSTVSGNTISSSGAEGILVWSNNYNNISGNKLYDNGTASSSIKIYLNSSYNQITDNSITDTAGAGTYAILINSGTNVNNYLSNNTYSGTGATSISDSGTGTIYANQQTSTGGLLNKVGTDSTTAFQVQNAAGTQILTIDSSNSKVNTQGINSVATLGAEKVTNGTFTGNATGWALAGGWAYNSNTIKHTAGSSGTAQQNVTAAIGETYQVTFDVSARTAGSVTMQVGGVSGPAIAANTAGQIQVITATSTGNLIFTADSAFDGVLDNVSVKKITLTKAVVSINNSDATAGIEIRSGGSSLRNEYIGVSSGSSNTTGSDNVSLGYFTLQSNITGSGNNAFGSQALQSNTTGNYNLGIGDFSLNLNTSGNQNIALGHFALTNSTTSNDNVAIGVGNLQANTTGSQNTSGGSASLSANTAGFANTAFGFNSLLFNTTGSFNTALGQESLSDDNDGFFTPSNLQKATGLGFQAEAQASNVLILGGQGTNAVNVGIGTTAPSNTFSVSPVYYDTAGSGTAGGAGTAYQNNGTVGVAGTKINGIGTTWTSTMVGMEFIFANTDGSTITKETITGFTNTTTLTGSVSQLVGLVGTPKNYRIHNPAFYVTSTGQTQIRTSSNSTTAFQVQNAAGNRVLGVDTTTAAITLARGSLTLSPGVTSPVASLATAAGGTLAAGTYSYKVAAQTEGGDAMAVATSPASIATAASGKNTLTWTAVSGATGYTVWRAIGTLPQCNWKSTNVAGGGTGTLVDNGSVTFSGAGVCTNSSDNISAIGALNLSNNSSINLGDSQLVTDVNNNRLYINNWDSNAEITLQAGGLAFYDTNNGARDFYIANSTGSAVFAAQQNSASAFQIQDQTGTNNLFTADTTNMRISVGSLGTATGQLYVGGSLPTSAIGSVTPGSGPSFVQVVGNYAYVTNNTAGTFNIVDVSNPSSPSVISTWTTNATPSGTAVQGHYAYVVTNGTGFQVFDVSNPKTPSAALSNITIDTGGNNVVVQGRYAYVSTSSGMAVIDISNPASPYQVGHWTAATGPQYAVFIQGRYAYVAGSDDHFHIIDVSNPANPVASNGVGTLITGGYQPHAVWVQGRYAYVAERGNNRLDIFDISDPTTTAAAIGTIATGMSTPEWLHVQGRYAYVTNNGNATVSVYDVSTPTSPVVVGTIPTSGAPWGDYVQGRYLYVATRTAPLMQIFDLGGEYAQQFEAGGAKVGTLDVSSNSIFAGDVNIQGGTSIGQSLQVSGNLAVSGSSSAFTNTGEISGWTLSSTTLPAINMQYASATYNGYAYVLGGDDNSSTDYAGVYYAKLNADGSMSTFTATTSLPAPRERLASVVSNGYVYAIGGQNGGTDQNSVYYARLNSDGTVGSWNTTTSLPVLLSGFNSVTTNGYVYVLGGGTAGVAQTATYYAKLNADGTIGSWSTGPVLGTATQKSAAVVSNGFVYILGGDNGTTTTTSTYRAAIGSNGLLGSWTADTVMPAALSPDKAAITLNGRVYIFGGATNTGSGASASVYYATLSNTGGIGAWTTSANPVPVTLRRIQPVAANGYIYAMGGAPNGVVAPTTSIYITSTNRVSLGGSLDLVGLNGGNLSNASDGSQGGSIGGSITAGNILGIGSLQIQGQGSFAQGVSIGGALNVAGSISVQSNLPTTAYGTVATSNNFQDTKIVGGYAYVADCNNNLRIYDISNPQSMTLKSSLDINVAATGGCAQALDVEGQYAYVVNEIANKLIVVDIGNPSNPILLGSATTGTLPLDVAVSGRYAYVANGSSSSISIFDVSNPETPTLVNAYTTPTGFYNFTILGKYLYGINTAVTNNVLYIFDISNPVSPVIKSTLTLTGDITCGGVNLGPNNLTVQGKYAYVATCSNDKLQIIDISNPASPSVTASTTAPAGGPHKPSAVAVYGKYAYVTMAGTGFVYVFDVSNASSPVTVGSWQNNNGSSTSPLAITIKGHYAFVTNYNFGAINSYDIGGITTNGLTAGSIETDTLSVNGDSILAGAINIQGGANIGQGLQIQGPTAINVSNPRFIGDGAGSFDIGNAQTPASPWAKINGGETTFLTSSTQHHSGADSLQVTTQAVANEGAKYVVQLNPNTAYNFSLWVSGNVAAWSTFAMGSNINGTITDCLSAQTVANASFTQFSCTFSTGATTTATDNVYFRDTSATVHTMFVDDVILEGISPITALTINSTNSSISLLDVKSLSQNFGSAITGGAFISRNSYFGEEFGNIQTNDCSQTTTSNNVHSRGDYGQTNATCATAGTGEISTTNVLGAAAGGNTCLEQSQSTLNGIERIKATGTGTANNTATCAEYLAGKTNATTNLMFQASNLPVMTAKVTPSTYAAATNALMVVGLGTSGATSTASKGMPTDGIFFTNCTTYSTTAPTCPSASPTWHGFVVAGSTLIGSVQNCTAGADTGNIVQGKTSYLRIEVRNSNTNDIHFFVDTDTSNGINETECGTGVATGTTPGATGLTMWLQSTVNTATATSVALDVDYFRVWQDENVNSQSTTATDTTTASLVSSDTATTTTPPISPDSSDPNVVGSFFNFLGATSEDTVINGNLYVHGTIYADKIKANEIEGLSIYTDQLASLQRKLAAVTSTSTNPTATTTNNTVIQTATMSINMNDGLTVGGDANFQGNVFFYKLVTFIEKTVFNNDVTFAAHIATAGQSPTDIIEPAAGLTTAPLDNPRANLATATVTGNDNSGQLNITSGDSSTNGKLITVNFAKPFDKAPQIILTPTNSQTANVKYYVQSTANGFAIYVVDPIGQGTNLTFNYLVVQ